MINLNRNVVPDAVSRVRVCAEEELLDSDVDKLMSLQLENMRMKHGEDTVESIRKEAMFLFYRNEPRKRHNTDVIMDIASKDNPVALIKCKCSNKSTGKGDRRHYDKDPPHCMLCVDARVAIHSRNFWAEKGLHNNAIGTVKEIMFDHGHSPNHGDLPRHVVVEFPLCCGPPWDTSNPKVSKVSISLFPDS